MTDEWAFERGDIVREKHAKYGQMGEPEPKEEYKIRRRLRDEDEEDGERFYHVEKENDGTHLCSDGVLEGPYEQIDEDASRVWPKEDGGLFD